ncbi:MAG TPA: ATP-binding cassette domain-containing protein [Candidatus Kapabacteria bacterium]|nr:ATP-binding cassette domain-containing protein [Candidatus Kapabacteria bacterium]
MIEIRDVYKSFGSGLRPLQGVSLDVPTGTNVVVLGKSGSGKSVLLKSIVGLLIPEHGSITVAGEEVVGADHKTLQSIRRKVGYVFQSGALYDSLTVGENLAFPLEKTRGITGSEARERVMHYLEQVGLPEKVNKMPSELSGGQRKRIGVARTIITEPEYLLYDEPTTGLDPQTTKEIAELIVHLKQDLKITAVTVTHDPYCLHIVADTVAYLEDGKILFNGTKDEAHRSDVEFLRIFFSLQEHRV